MEELTAVGIGILVLLDGCATCHKGGKITGLRVTHREEDGGFFSKCSDIEEEFEAFSVSKLDIKVGAKNNVDMATLGFSVPFGDEIKKRIELEKKLAALTERFNRKEKKDDAEDEKTRKEIENIKKDMEITVDQMKE
uniref:Cytochrome c domain-containing protein n=1 Tax=Meloidogyne floridensis TaxID=298350 RepID=A0A915NE90_9BILA